MHLAVETDNGFLFGGRERRPASRAHTDGGLQSPCQPCYAKMPRLCCNAQVATDKLRAALFVGSCVQQ